MVDLLAARKAYLAAQRASERAVEARAALPLGSTRARVTTANARWMRAAEERDRCRVEYVEALQAELAARGRLPLAWVDGSPSQALDDALDALFRARKELDDALDALFRARKELDDAADRLYRERIRRFGATARFTREGPTVADVRAYRDANGCSLQEAVKAVGWTGTQAEIIIDGGAHVDPF